MMSYTSKLLIFSTGSLKMKNSGSHGRDMAIPAIPVEAAVILELVSLRPSVADKVDS